MFLKIDQSVSRCCEELVRKALTPANAFENVMRSLDDDRDRRRLAWCFAAEDAEAARNLAFGDLEPKWHAWLARHEIGVAPIWTPGGGEAAGWGAALSASGAGAFQALTELPEALRSRVREVTLKLRDGDATSAAEHFGRWSFPALDSLDCLRCDTSVAVILAARTPTLTRLVANASKAPDALLAVISERRGLQALGLVGDAVSDSLSSVIGDLALRRFTLAAFDVTKDVADAIGAAATLEALVLAGACSAGLKKANFKRLTQQLGKHGRLREFTIDGSFRLIDDKAMVSVEALTGLRNIRVSYTDGSRTVPGTFLRKIDAAHLENIHLHKVVLGASDLNWISVHHQLTRVYLAYTQATAEGVAQLASLPALAVLHVAGSRVSHALPSLCATPSLFRLRLDLDQENEAIFSTTPVPKGLREVDFSLENVSARCAEALAAWPLEALNVASRAMVGARVAQLGTDGAKELAKCKSLEWLHVGAHDIGPDGARALATLPRLRWLHMPGNPIGAGVAGFADAPALRVAYLNNCDLPPETPKWLGQVSTLEEAYLWDNAIDGSHLDEFAKLPKLRELNLANNPVAPAAAEDLRRLAPHVKIVAPRPGAPDPTAGLANTAVVTVNGGAFRPGSGSS